MSDKPADLITLITSIIHQVKILYTIGFSLGSNSHLWHNNNNNNNTLTFILNEEKKYNLSSVPLQSFKIYSSLLSKNNNNFAV